MRLVTQAAEAAGLIQQQMADRPIPEGQVTATRTRVQAVVTTPEQTAEEATDLQEDHQDLIRLVQEAVQE